MEELNLQLNLLNKNKSWASAVDATTSFCNLLGLKIDEDPFLLQHPKINAHTSWFEQAPGFVNRPAAYELIQDSKPLDMKLYWSTKITKTNLSWLVGITSNFEDAKTFESDKHNIGIDIVVPKECDRIILLVSNKYKVRSLELKEALTRTDREILEKVLALKDKKMKSVEDKQVFHNLLWDAFNFEPINRKFYKELVDRFTVLRDYLVLNKFENQDAVMFSTRLIGRLLFTWFLRKKNLINEKVGYFKVLNAYDQTEYYKDRLEVLFFETLNTEILERGFDDKFTPYLNGGLFEASRTDFYKDSKLKIPDGYFTSFFEVLSHYNFTVDESSPEFEQVAVDPEMLGRIFESLLAEQRTETGEQARKAKGAFYTPREIVSYMCEQSLKEYLKTKIEDDANRDTRIEELVSMSESIFRDQDHNKRRDWKPYKDSTIKALDDLKIFDPAVGSGAYPMGMLHLLVKVYTRIDSKYEKNISKLKRDILSRSLYGSDIDMTAIEICRLRAWLSLIVDIELGEQVAPLPNLEFHFVCANTLISLPKETSLFEIPGLRDNLKIIREEYYNTSSKTKKESLKKKYEKLLPNQNKLSVSDIADYDNTLMTYRPFSHESRASFFDPDLMFGIDKFDVVIGNPPYVQIQKFKGQQIQKDIENQKFETFEKTGDLYGIFYEYTLNLTKKDTGLQCFITSNKWMRAGYGEKLRKFFLKKTMLNLIDLGSGVFESATVDTNILLIKNKE